MTDTLVLTNAYLKGLMTDAVVDRGIASLDANNITKAGVYRLDRPEAENPAVRKNYPSTACRAMIAVFQQQTFCIQLFIAQATSVSYIRLKWSTGGWSPWKLIT